MNHEPKPSFAELALRSRRAMVMGIGGGGDVIQTIPLANYLALLGIREISVGGVGCQWWTPDGHPMAGGKSMVILGPTVYPVEELSDAETWAPGLVRVTSRSNVGGRRPAEAAIADLLPWPAFVVGLTGGVVGMAAGLSAFIRERGIDLFVAVDIGSDSFFSGKESAPTHTSMVDFMSLGALLQLPCPTVFGLAGYGCDGEMALEELEQNVGIVMRHGGYLGAHGLTQRDVIEMERACAAYGDPVEIWSPRAARGELGLRNVRIHSPWGQPIRVTPLAAVILFFDPRVLVEHVCTGVRALMNTRSLAEAEEIYDRQLGLLPETRLQHVVDFMRSEGDP